VKAQVTVATGEQSWLGRLFSVDALNMLERFDAGSGAAGRRRRIARIDKPQL
jgi:hypothetical protein